MPKTIIQKVEFKNTTTKDLYNLYLNAKKHSEATGATARISAKEGSTFSIYDGYITGKNLRLVKDELIVQTWRAQDWNKQDNDSTFVISLEQKGKNAILTAVHVNVPSKQVKGVAKGWYDYYWEPWEKHLGGKPREKIEKM